MNNTSGQATQKKEYLQSFITINNSIKTTENLIKTFSKEQDRYSFMLLSSNTAEKYNSETINLISNLGNLLSEKNQICRLILLKINDMDSEVEKNLLTLKYISGYTWEQISELMNYSLRQVYNIHNNALKHFKNN